MKLNLSQSDSQERTASPLTKGGVVQHEKGGRHEKIYFVGDDCHSLCVGVVRSGKSCLVLESICLWGLPESPSSFNQRPSYSTTPLNF
ncbi:MAG: hypothetical protein ACLRJV_08700 [Eubacteriales bacterium]